MNLRKKMLSLLAVLAIVLTLPAGCAQDSSEAETVKIGYLCHITGDSALWGMAERDGAIIAVDEINEDGGILGKKIELLIYDGRGQSADSVNAAKKAVEQDKVLVLLGSNLSGPTIAAAPICERAKVPQIATFATNPKVTIDDKGNVRPWSFRLCFTDSYQGTIIADYAVNKLDKMRAGILYDVTSDYSSGLSEEFEERFNDLGGTIVAKEAFRSGDLDFRPQLSEIAAKQPDILVLPNLYKENALIAKQAYEVASLKGITMMAGDSYSPVMFEMAGDEALDNYYTVQHFHWDDPALKELKEKYVARFGEEDPELNVVMGYDAVYFIKDCIERAEELDPEKIRTAIENAKEVKLTHATITIDPETHNPLNKEAVIVSLADGKATFVEKYVPGE